jgi:hypothetical protein
MKKIIIMALIMGFPLMAFSQANKMSGSKIKRMTVTEHVYEKGVEKVFKDTEIKYDANGNITEEIEYKAGKINKHFLYQYDASNKKIMETELDPAGKKIKITEYKYNSNNLRTERAVYDANRNLKSKKTYQYESY